MATKYVIIKASRDYTGGPGYAGIACEDAGVPEGKVYDTRKEAEEDAAKLLMINKIGWRVEEYREPVAA